MPNEYLMENQDEICRLEMKTDSNIVENQVLWAGLRPGMRAADIGCGSGKTTAILHKIVCPGGSAIGIDSSTDRIRFSRQQYGNDGIEFFCRDVKSPLDDMGRFDFIWVRFFLEYYRTDALEVLNNICKILKPGGILCLVDLDFNSICHYGLTPKMENALLQIIKLLQIKSNFDPYVGRKLYSFLYDMSFDNINVNIAPYNLIFGDLSGKDRYNWTKKIEILKEVSRANGLKLKGYEGGIEQFCDEFLKFFSSRRRFTYTPLIMCRGEKPK